jgi:two-component system alkaline phosphatase synthesis response regulator PhoP/two-component system response regulator VicR
MAAILVVDDNDDSLRIIQMVLESNGYQARTAKSGKVALGLVNEEIPDLILLDVMMPEMSGMEVLERLRASPKTARVPVIMLTAKAQDEDVLEGYKEGADYYITKPFTAKQLLYGIRLVLQEPAA